MWGSKIGGAAPEARRLKGAVDATCPKSKQETSAAQRSTINTNDDDNNNNQMKRRITTIKLRGTLQTAVTTVTTNLPTTAQSNAFQMSKHHRLVNFD